MEAWERDDPVKFVFLNVESKSPGWLKEAKETYIKKISAFYSSEEIQIKSPDIDRDDRSKKVLKEQEKIEKQIKPRDFVVLFDEDGESLGSISFSKKLQKKIETSPERIVFLVGGAFGVSDALKKRAHWTVSLSQFTFNHWVAQLVVLEQVYRSQCIVKNLPYHNE